MAQFDAAADSGGLMAAVWPLASGLLVGVLVITLAEYSYPSLIERLAVRRHVRRHVPCTIPLYQP